MVQRPDTNPANNNRRCFILPWAHRQTKYTRYRNPFADLSQQTNTDQSNETFSSVDPEDATTTSQDNNETSTNNDAEPTFSNADRSIIGDGNCAVDREDPVKHVDATTTNQDNSETSTNDDAEHEEMANKIIKLEDTLRLTKIALARTNQRLVNETLSSSESEDLSDIENPVVKSKYHNRDRLFASKYDFITNVISSSQFNRH